MEAEPILFAWQVKAAQVIALGALVRQQFPRHSHSECLEAAQRRLYPADGAIVAISLRVLEAAAGGVYHYTPREVAIVREEAEQWKARFAAQLAEVR